MTASSSRRDVVLFERTIFLSFSSRTSDASSASHRSLDSLGRATSSLHMSLNEKRRWRVIDGRGGLRDDDKRIEPDSDATQLVSPWKSLHSNLQTLREN